MKNKTKIGLLILSLFVCVKSHAQTTERIINGITVNRAVPYMTALYLDDQFFCGGTLIKPGWVLTAAHCAELSKFYDLSFFKVGVGGKSLSHPKARSGVESVFFDNWSGFTYKRDWALFKLKRKLKSRLYPKLATKNVVGNHRAFGWGITESGAISSQLKELKFPIWQQSQCSTVLGDEFDDKTMICGVKLSSSNEVLDGGDTCNADSGGPITSLNRRVLYGITSWGDECASSFYPGVYASVSAGRNWILETIKNNS